LKFSLETFCAVGKLDAGRAVMGLGFDFALEGDIAEAPVGLAGEVGGGLVGGEVIEAGGEGSAIGCGTGGGKAVVEIEVWVGNAVVPEDWWSLEGDGGEEVDPLGEVSIEERKESMICRY